ncbi:MAG: hypothetical protein ACI85O_002846 [Saprospiraceae bacterium]|jgi:hypothetical protein
MLQKLTYGETKCNNYLYLTFDGDYFDTDIITKKLNIKPTNVRIKKDPVPKSTCWQYEIHVGDDVDLVTVK